MILLLTSDDGLRRRVARALGGDHVVVACDTEIEVASKVGGFVIVDCRNREAAERFLVQRRMETGSCLPCVGVARSDDVGSVRVLAQRHPEVLDVIIPETDSAADILRAHVNDPTRSAAGAIALELLLRFVPKSAHQVLNSVVGSGFRIGTVKHLAAFHRRDSSGAGRKLRETSSWTQIELVELAKAAYVVLLLGDVGLGLAEICVACGYAKTESLSDLLRRTLAVTVEAVQNDAAGPACRAWLAQRLQDVVDARTRTLSVAADGGMSRAGSGSPP